MSQFGTHSKAREIELLTEISTRTEYLSSHLLIFFESKHGLGWAVYHFMIDDLVAYGYIEQETIYYGKDSDPVAKRQGDDVLKITEAGKTALMEETHATSEN